MRSLLILLGLAAPDMTARVATEAAVTINQPVVVKPVDECCGNCKNGVITHGDGHKTLRPCPSTCKCKAKSQTCESGTCTLKR